MSISGPSEFPRDLVSDLVADVVALFAPSLDLGPLTRDVRAFSVNARYASLLRQLKVVPLTCKIAGVDPIPAQLWPFITCSEDVRAFLCAPAVSLRFALRMNIRLRSSGGGALLAKSVIEWFLEFNSSTVDYVGWAAICWPGPHDTLSPIIGHLPAHLSPSDPVSVFDSSAELLAVVTQRRIGDSGISYGVWRSETGVLYHVTQTSITRCLAASNSPGLGVLVSADTTPGTLFNITCQVSAIAFAGGHHDRVELIDDIEWWCSALHDEVVGSRSVQRSASVGRHSQTWWEAAQLRDADVVTYFPQTSPVWHCCLVSDTSSLLSAAYVARQRYDHFTLRQGQFSPASLVLASMLRDHNGNLGPAEFASEMRAHITRIAVGERLTVCVSGGDAYAVLAPTLKTQFPNPPNFFMDEPDDTWTLLPHLGEVVHALGLHNNEAALAVILGELEREKPCAVDFSKDFAIRLLATARGHYDLDVLVHTLSAITPPTVAAAVTRSTIGLLKAGGYGLDDLSVRSACFWFSLPEGAPSTDRTVTLRNGVPLDGLTSGVSNNGHYLYYAGRHLLVSFNERINRQDGRFIRVVHLDRCDPPNYTESPLWEPLDGCFAKDGPVSHVTLHQVDKSNFGVSAVAFVFDEN